MCGRYTIFTDADEKELFDIISAANLKYGGLNDEGAEIAPVYKTGEIFPSNIVTALVLSEARTAMSVTLQSWGFKNNRGGLIINARRETVIEKPMFHDSFFARRSVIPSTGFYEWSHDAEKQKYQFNIKGTRMLYMAGIWRLVGNMPCFVILTGEANASMSDIHDRMPLILNRDELGGWLSDDDKAVELTKSPLPELVRVAV